MQLIDISDKAWGVISIFASMILLAVKTLFDKGRKTQLDTAKESAAMTDLLTKHKHNTTSSVAFILGYHNGGKLYNHQSREKFTMMYATRGLLKSMRDYKEIPVGFFGSMLLCLHEQGSLYHDKVTQNTDPYFINDSRYSEIMMTEFGAGCHYAMAFYSHIWKWRVSIFPLKRERVVAFSVHFVSDKPYTETELAELEIACSQTKKLLM